MLKKRYIKRLYIEEAICDICGARLKPTGYVLDSFPARHSYICSNNNCNEHATFREDELPNQLKYEFEDEENV